MASHITGASFVWAIVLTNQREVITPVEGYELTYNC